MQKEEYQNLKYSYDQIINYSDTELGVISTQMRSRSSTHGMEMTWTLSRENMLLLIKTCYTNIQFFLKTCSSIKWFFFSMIMILLTSTVNNRGVNECLSSVGV